MISHQVKPTKELTYGIELAFRLFVVPGREKTDAKIFHLVIQLPQLLSELLKFCKVRNLMNKFIAGTYAYGLVRSIAYAPPMKKEDYLVDHVSKVIIYTAGSPILFPVFIYIDLKNLEHVMRKMPGPIDGSPW